MNRSVFDPKNSPIGASRESAPSRTPGSAAGDELTVSTMTGPPIDPVETHSAELWTSLAVNRYREGLDIGALIEGRRILLLGDTNHGTLGLQRGLIDLLPGLREHGIEHLALEIPRNLAGGEPNEIAMRTRIPHCELELLDNAAALGFTVHFIDLADDDY